MDKGPAMQKSATDYRPRGVWAAVLLPFDEDDAIDRSALSAQLDYLCSSGVNGIYAFGTAGEFHVVTEAEFETVAALVAETASRREIEFQIGICDSNPRRSLDRARWAADQGASALQVILPDWVAPNDQEGIDFVRRIADEAAPTPLVLYNPPHAKRQLGADDFRRLADAVPAIIGVKLLDEGALWYDHMRPLFDRLSVFIPGHHMASGVLAGAHGSYSNIACLSPKATLGWWRLIQADAEAALAVEQQIGTLFASVVQPMLTRDRLAPFAFDKALAAVGGWAPINSRVRWPYESMRQDRLIELKRAISDHVPALLALETPDA